MELEKQFWSPDFEEQQLPQVPRINVFREAVDKIPDLRDQILIKTLYLLAARCCEITTKVTPYEMRNNVTKPYGRLLSWSLADYERKTNKKTEKILLLKSAVAKRTKKPKGSNTEKNKTKIRFKIVALPANPLIEPWTLDILKWIRKQKDHKLAFPIVRETVQAIVKRQLRRIDNKVHPHKIRHWRISHLITEYSLNPYEVTAYAGWSFGSTFGQMGIQASSNLDVYAHLIWRDYVEKLLKPMQDILA